jgi:sialidase-1
LVIDPHSLNLVHNRRTLVGTLWLDPLGRLWLFFDQGLTYFDGRSGVWYTRCDNPDNENPIWSTPVRIWHGCTLNKPTILSNGNWVLPVSLWDREKIKDSAFRYAFQNLDSLRMAHMFISKDQGATWERQGGIRFPKPQFDEHHILERKDGTLWITARTGDGIWESISSDKGKTWSDPRKYMEHIGSRHFIRKLKSERWLLVKHGEINERTHTRSKLMAFLSDDEGKIWQGGLMIDERRGVSYPDGFQSDDGTIYVSYDRNRDTDGEILMASFTEKDILNKKFSSAGSKTKMIISKPQGLDKLPPPSNQKTNKNLN